MFKMGRSFANFHRSRCWKKTVFWTWIFEVFLAVVTVNILIAGLNFIQATSINDSNQWENLDVHGHFALSLPNTGTTTSGAIEERLLGDGQRISNQPHFTNVPCSLESFDEDTELCNAVCYPFVGECINMESSSFSGDMNTFCACFLEQQIEREPCLSPASGEACKEACPADTISSFCRPLGNGSYKCYCNSNVMDDLELSKALQVRRASILCGFTNDGQNQIEICSIAFRNGMRGSCRQQTLPNKKTYSDCLCQEESERVHNYLLSSINTFYPPTLDPCALNFPSDTINAGSKRVSNCFIACMGHKAECFHIHADDTLDADLDTDKSEYCFCETSDTNDDHLQGESSETSLFDPPGLSEMHQKHDIFKSFGNDPCHAKTHHLCHGGCHAACLYGTVGRCQFLKEESQEERLGPFRHDYAHCFCFLEDALQGMTLPIAYKQLGGVPSNFEFKIPCEQEEYKGVCLIVCYPYDGHCHPELGCVCTPDRQEKDPNPCSPLTRKSSAETSAKCNYDCKQNCPDSIFGYCHFNKISKFSCYCRNANGDSFMLGDHFEQERGKVLCKPKVTDPPDLQNQLGRWCSIACPMLLPGSCININLIRDSSKKTPQCQCRMYDIKEWKEVLVPLNVAQQRFPPTNDACATPWPKKSKAYCEAACQLSGLKGECLHLTNDRRYYLLTYCFCRIVIRPAHANVKKQIIFMTPSEAENYPWGSNKRLFQREYYKSIYDTEALCRKNKNGEHFAGKCKEKCPRGTVGRCASLTNDPEFRHCICFPHEAYRGWPIHNPINILSEDQVYQETTVRCPTQVDICFELCSAVCYPFFGIIQDPNPSGNDDLEAQCACLANLQIAFEEKEDDPCRRYKENDKSEAACLSVCPIDATKGTCIPQEDKSLQCHCENTDMETIPLTTALVVRRNHLLCNHHFHVHALVNEPCRFECQNALLGYCFPTELGTKNIHYVCHCTDLNQTPGAERNELSIVNRLYPPTTDPCAMNFKHNSRGHGVEERLAGCVAACGELYEASCFRQMSNDHNEFSPRYCFCVINAESKSPTYFALGLRPQNGLSGTTSVKSWMIEIGHRDPCRVNRRYLQHCGCHWACPYGTEGSCKYIQVTEDEVGESDNPLPNQSHCFCKNKGAKRAMTLSISHEVYFIFPSNFEFKIPCEWNKHDNVCEIVCLPFRGYCDTSSEIRHCICIVHINMIALDPCHHYADTKDDKDSIDAACRNLCKDSSINVGFCKVEGGEKGECLCYDSSRSWNPWKSLVEKEGGDILCQPDRDDPSQSTIKLAHLCTSACPYLLSASCKSMGVNLQCMCRHLNEPAGLDKYIPLDEANKLFPPTDDACSTPWPEKNSAECKKACLIYSHEAEATCCHTRRHSHYELLTYCFCKKHNHLSSDASEQPIIVFMTPFQAHLENDQDDNHCRIKPDDTIDDIECRKACPDETEAACELLEEEQIPGKLNAAHCFCFIKGAIRGWPLSHAIKLFTRHQSKLQSDHRSH